MQNLDRRNFIKCGAVLAGGCGFGQQMAAVETEATISNSIGVSSYSFWAFRRDEFRPLETCLDHAARMGFDGLEILQRQLVETDSATLQKIKRHAFLNGLDLMGFSTHQGFLSPDKVKRQKNIDHTIDCLEQAYQLYSYYHLCYN